MPKFEFFEHTADVKFKAYGKTLAEAFENSAKATFKVMTDIEKVSKSSELTIEVSAVSVESLVFNFLDELIFIMDSEAFLLNDIKVEIKDLTLKATIVGDYQQEFKYDVHTYVKAVTLNELKVEKSASNYTIQVVLDI